MTTRADLRNAVASRLGDPTLSSGIWTQNQINDFIDKAIKALYPVFFQLATATTTAGAGPMQNIPTGAFDIYSVAVLDDTATRARIVRQWREGSPQTLVPPTNITGFTLIWSWTKGFIAPTDDVTTLDLYPQCEEIVVLRSCISALTQILADRASQQKYFALTVREDTTEVDLVHTIDMLQAEIDKLEAKATPRPARVG